MSYRPLVKNAASVVAFCLCALEIYYLTVFIYHPSLSAAFFLLSARQGSLFLLCKRKSAPHITPDAHPRLTFRSSPRTISAAL